MKNNFQNLLLVILIVWCVVAIIVQIFFVYSNSLKKNNTFEEQIANCNKMFIQKGVIPINECEYGLLKKQCNINQCK